MRNFIEFDSLPYEKARLKDRIWAYHALGMHKEAIYDCRKLARLAPNDADSFVRLGYHCDEGGQTNKAIRYYKYALKRFPNDEYLYTNLGYCYEKYKKCTDMARACYEKALELDPSHVWALHNMRGILHKEHSHFAALRYSKKAWYAAKRKGELDYLIWHGLGYAYYRCRLYHRAWVILRYLQKKCPDNEAVWCDSGIVNYKIGAYSMALDQFSTALSLKPDSKYYRRLCQAAYNKVDKK